MITGEDRFLGYSLMCGTRATLIGMGAACTALPAALLHTCRWIHPLGDSCLPALGVDL